MSSGEKTTTQTQTSEPWSGAQPTIKTALGAANDVFRSGDAFQPYTGSSVVPYSLQSMAGMDDITGRAMGMMSGPNNFDAAYNFYGGMFPSGGLSPDQQSVADQYRTTASGSELSNVSPAFNDILSRIQGDTALQQNLAASGAGRYNSGLHADALGRAVGGVTSQALQSEYERQLARMDAARGNLANLGQQGITNRFGAAQQLPAAYQAMKAPATDLMGIGSMYEDLAGRQLSDQERIFRETQQSPLSAVEWLNAIGTGAGKLGGTAVGSVQQPTPNPFLQAGAVGLGGLNMLFNPTSGLFPGGLR